MEVVVDGCNPVPDAGVVPRFVFKVGVVCVVMRDRRVVEGSADGCVFMAIPDQELGVFGDWLGSKQERSVINEDEDAVRSFGGSWFVGEHGYGVARTSNVCTVVCWVRSAIDTFSGWEVPEV